MSDDKQTAWNDAHSLGIALRLAQAQIRDLRKQLAASTSNGSLKFQDGICHDCESPDLCIQDNGCHNSGKIFSRNDRPTCEKADSTSETPLTDAVTTGSTGDLDFIYDLTFLCRQLERKLAQAKKRLIDAEEILGELASGYWRQTLNNIDDRPARPDWPMGELIQLYWEKHNQGEQP